MELFTKTKWEQTGLFKQRDPHEVKEFALVTPVVVPLVPTPEILSGYLQAFFHAVRFPSSYVHGSGKAVTCPMSFVDRMMAVKIMVKNEVGTNISNKNVAEIFITSKIQVYAIPI